MEVQRVLCMNGGEGDTSYANNSLLQKMVMLKVKPILQESITELYRTSFPETECLKVADLGCSSGPNSLLPTWEIIESINSTSQQLYRKPPVLQAFLNDLPGNDFNTVFKSLPSFYERVEKEKGGGGKCFIAGVPGSFHGRLFPDHSLHSVHSSYSLHWLSQVPHGLVSDLGIPLNKGNICIASTSPPSVHKAYSDQFGRDFTAFLTSRSEEMIPGGRLVLSIMGENNDEDGCNIWELIGTTLDDMIMEGLVDEGKLDSFNIPFYMSSAAEVKRIIETEGSFKILRLETFKLSWDANIASGHQDLVFDNNARGKHVSMYMRAVAESVLKSHFGDPTIEGLFQRFSMKAADFLELGKGVHTNLVISLSTKE